MFSDVDSEKNYIIKLALSPRSHQSDQKYLGDAGWAGSAVPRRTNNRLYEPRPNTLHYIDEEEEAFDDDLFIYYPCMSPIKLDTRREMDYSMGRVIVSDEERHPCHHTLQHRGGGLECNSD